MSLLRFLCKNFQAGFDLMYYVETCPFCEQGNLGVRICSLAGDVVILCDECDALWLSTEISDPPAFPEQPDLPCPCCQGNLTDAPAHWASFGEIYQKGWVSIVKGEMPE
ncbi:hypothetical protein [uncultured Gimesia sp.]|uniref:hypothetical protein n=1 Tax=uncultured Gimesia sp. TaxID=1678688 RepID=UPI0030DBB230|tara:strand:+ start:41117 stop:41443 length:327 start_codon:yes stop_codon:yes gene_type:complete